MSSIPMISAPARKTLIERIASAPAASILKFSLGIVYLHFGFLKFYPDLSPAELLATQTIMTLSGHRLDAQQSLFLLALLETVIGLGFLFNVFRRSMFVLFTFHMLGTLTPLILLPEFAFKIAPLAPTIEGQYIIKNIVFLAAGWTILLPDALGIGTAKRDTAESHDSSMIVPSASLPATVMNPVRIAAAPHIVKEHQFCE